MKTMAATLYGLFKIRIGFAIMLSALAGYAVSLGPGIEAWRVGVLALAVLGASAAAGAFNQFAERDLDARMERTRNRPFASGSFTAGPLWLAVIVGLLALSVGGAALAANAVAALYVFLGAFVYGVVYTVWLKRRTAWNIVVGGLAGSFAVLAGAAAVDPTPGAAAWALAVVLFLWTPPHFWSLAMALKDDYARGGVPMLPNVVGDAAAARIILAHTVGLVAVSAFPAVLGLGWIYGLPAAVGGAWFLWASLRLVARPGRKAAMVNFFASLVQLTLVLGGAMLAGGLGG